MSEQERETTGYDSSNNSNLKSTMPKSSEQNTVSNGNTDEVLQNKTRVSNGESKSSVYDSSNINSNLNQNQNTTSYGSNNASANENNNYGYQNGYYRTKPHQDEPVGTRYTGTNSYSNSRASANYNYNNSSSNSSYNNNNSMPNYHYTNNPNNNASNNNYYSGAQQGNSKNKESSPNANYSYVNYSSPQSISGSENSPKNKKSKTCLKIVACVAALAVVSAGSIGIYRLAAETPVISESSNSISSNSSKNSDDSTEEESSKSSNKAAEGEQLKDNNEINAPSWIELAAGKNAMSVTDIVKKVTPSVVGVQATFQIQRNGYGFYGFNAPQSSEAIGVGTGIVMKEDGYIVTNAHVIYDSQYGSGEAAKVEVKMSDQETIYDADIVAYDVESDIAVLKVNHQDGFVAAEFGDSDNCEVGEMVVAIGNPLGLELQNTVTCGIISALNRKVTINDKTMTLIQTDTAINSGNSGGPLINSAGQVIGINSAKMSSSVSSGSASVEGIGFAIPMTEAKEIVDDLINHGYVTGRPQLGITCQDVSESVSQAYNMPVGVYIVSITDGGAADLAGLQTADIITKVEGKEITTSEELTAYKNEHNAGDTITLTVVRGGQTMDVEVTLQESVSTRQ
ncbi:MAG: trypsin-like peptidase domain-containing protein [Ruminococcus sp.]|nr:trypsin-like peptidase domain-containing protein [Ruminococcus sp.]